jgi:hypothetical protein
MTQLERTIERLQALPEERQNALAAHIETLLDAEADDDLLTPEDWAEIERRLDAETADIAHEDVVAAFEARVSS